MAWQEAIGYLAGTITMLAVVPQIVKAWKTQETEGLSLSMLGILMLGLGLWVVYGVLTKTWPIVVTNGISFLLYSFLFGFVLVHRPRQ